MFYTMLKKDYVMKMVWGDELCDMNFNICSPGISWKTAF